MPFALLASCLGLVLFIAWATGGLREAEQVVARNYADSLKALDEVRTAASDLSHLQIDHLRARIATNPDERAQIASGIAARHRTLTANLGVIAARTRAVRVSQAAVSAQDAVNIWHDAIWVASGEQDRTAERERLADGAHAQIAQLAGATEKQGLLSRKTAEGAVAARIRMIAAVVAAAAVWIALLAWLVAFRVGRAPVAIPQRKNAEAAAKATHPIAAENRLKDVLDIARDGIVVLGRDHRVVYANPSAAALIGIPADALRPGEPAESALSFVPHGDLQAGEADIGLAGGRWLRVSRSPMPDGGALIVFGDVSDRKHRDAGAEAIADSLRTALDSMSQGLCLYDAAHRLVVANRRYEEIYNHEPGSLQAGTTATEILERSMAAGNHPGSTLSELLDEAGRVLATSDTGDNFQELAGGRIVQINVGETAEGGFVATYDDVTERWHAESRIAYMARHDGLTDLPNRVLLAERIEGAITQASREAGFGVHCLDLDNFKQINDTLGHAVGDELLRAVAHRLTACLREVDTVARLGGDEFAIVQAGVETAEDAAVLAQRIIEVVSAPYELAEHSVTIGVSIGIALAPTDGMAPDSLLKNADVALYKSKGDGRGVFRFFEAEMDDRLQARRLLEIDLRAAVAAQAFELHYQPIYDLSRDRISGFEALLRWTHPTRGPVSPVEFVPLAEEIGLIVPLGEWVLRQACAEASRWPGNLKIAVNVSPAQFRSAQLISTVREALAETGLAAQRLELEITETVLLANRGATVAILHALRAMGTRIAMDDFGTGYSSLSYLRSFPFDKMKIDQSFIRDLTVENGSGFIVQAVISLGTNLGMTMTAEGVETEDQLARLRAEGCDEAQGYLFSRPVPVSQIAGLLEKWNGAGDVAQAA
ncbi:putative bifunctional diguanylate cyclase/phosphodiesterase [Methylobacterium haplocladii]|uniref:Diguanylate cyclase n=1 Tax=Methylobacterium haplocladii TaxID=1176176 RepID=A0A512IMG1_9HYPH|nr:EAL domain-containing protein [Methylobacterium haplocladii]GEO98907.1 hypothetical protein MHA02_12950 [Methylobacterium haplocladii]GJD85293.1 hypothetical protein HPGCJGGD_3181 [Methylobacterium haplocladii]GLS58104.1 hypothetical protein GCM10007887_07600 [Methylobacterium haplocladii]